MPTRKFSLVHALQPSPLLPNRLPTKIDGFCDNWLHNIYKRCQPPLPIDVICVNSCLQFCCLMLL